MRIRRQKRRGVAAVESAIVLPILLTILLGLIGGSFAVFIYQQTAALAREGARYAAVHGHEYALSTNTAAITNAQIYNNSIANHMVAMDPANLTYTITWDPDQRQGSFVTVTVTYNLTLPLFGSLSLTSSSTEEVHW